MDLSEALHIAGSDSPAGCLKVATHLRCDQVLVNEDPISCGPGPATLDLNEWRLARQGFIKEVYVDWPDFSFDHYAENGLLMNADRLATKDVVAWVALGLHEQLVLSWVVFLFDVNGFDASNLNVIQFEMLRPNQRVLSTGEISPENIVKYQPQPQQLGSRELDELRRAWKVYTSDDPTDLSTYIGEPGPLPALHSAMACLILRYPDAQSGLSYWDERLLHYTNVKGPKATRVIGYTMGYNETLDYIGDLYLFRRLVALGDAGLRSPLLSITGNTQNMRECEVELTPFGHEVLVGRVNHVRENGIDDWIGGVHLSDQESVTYRDGTSLVLT